MSELSPLFEWVFLNIPFHLLIGRVCNQYQRVIRLTVPPPEFQAFPFLLSSEGWCRKKR